MGGGVVVVGCVVLTGWVLGIHALTSLIPWGWTMKANTALAFILCGVALLLLQLPGAWARLVARSCALVVGAVALLTLVEYVCSCNFGIDEFVLRDHGQWGGIAHPGRMAPNTATALVLQATALWLMSLTVRTARRSWLLALLGSLVLAIGLIAMLSYLAEFRAGYSWWNLTAMPMHTALLVVILGTAVLRFTWRQAGMHWMINQRLTLGFACVLALLVALAVYSNRSTRELVEAAGWVKHTHEVIGKMSGLRTYLDESQSGVRGYVITGDAAFLQLSDKAIPAILQHLAELRGLRELTLDNPGQQARLAQLEQLIPEWLGFAQQVVEQRTTTGFDSAVEQSAARRGKAMMDQIRAVLEAMDAEEYRLLAVREARAATITDRTFAILPVGVLVSVLAFAYGLLRLNGEVAIRQRGAATLANERNLLRTLVDLLPTLIYVKDRDSRFLLANIACANKMGAATPQELIGKTDAEYYPPETAAGFRHEELEVLDGIPMVDKEHFSSSPGGTRQVLLTTKVPLRDNNGNIIGLVGASFDITEHMRAADVLREQERLLADSQAVAHVGSWMFDLASGKLTWSEETFRLYGLSPATDQAPRSRPFPSCCIPTTGSPCGTGFLNVSRVIPWPAWNSEPVRSMA